jgi:hypothetical protein
MFYNVMYPRVVEQCMHAGTDLTPCKPSSPDSPCASGYDGRLCAACAPGYFRTGDRCSSCPAGGSLIVLGITVVLAVIGVFVWSFFVGSSSSGYVKVLLFFVQGLFFIRTPMPSNLYAFTNGSSSISMVSWVGPECFMSDWDENSAFTSAVAAPFVACMLCLLTAFVGRAISSILSKRGFSVQHWYDRCRRSALFLVLFLYMSAVTAVLTPLSCSLDPGDGHEYMVAHPASHCSAKLRTSAIVLCFFYLGLLPAGLVVLVRRHGLFSTSVLRHDNSVRNADRNALAMGPMYVYSLLFASYRDGRRAWEIVVTVRRVLFVAAFVAIPGISEFRTVVLSSVLSLSVLLQSVFSPFSTPLANQLETVSLLLLLVNLAASTQSQVLGIVDVNAAGIVVFVLDLLFVMLLVGVLLRQVWKSASQMMRSMSKSGNLSSSLLADKELDDVATPQHTEYIQ